MLNNFIGGGASAKSGYNIRAELIKQLEEVVKNNEQLWGNILLENRVFHRIKDEHHEYLISLNNVAIEPHYWGHIFWHDDRYVSCIVALDFWFNSVEEKLFDLYHYNLEVLGHWYPVGGNSLSFSGDIETAVEQMSSLIRNFRFDNTLSKCNYMITQIYPFPNVFEELSFEQWKILKEQNNV